MKQATTEYKQAIIIGASPMGSEESALLKLLKWAGKSGGTLQQGLRHLPYRMQRENKE